MNTVTKKLGIWALGTMCLFATGDALAGSGDVRIGPKVGIALPIGDFGDFADLGFLFGATGDFGVNESIMIGGDLLYNPFSVNDIFDDLDTSYSVIHVTGHARYQFESSSSLRPFALGGLGIYFGRLSQDGEINGFSVSGSDTESDIGIQVGGGVQLPVGENAIEFSGVFHIISDSNMITFAASLPFSVVAGE